MRHLSRIGLCVLVSGAVLAANPDRLKDSAAVLNEMVGQGDAGISPDFFAKARCVIVVPNLTKAAFGFGGQFGKGYVSCRRGSGWSAPGAVRIEGGSFGLQIGASSTDVILLVMNDRGMDRLLSNEFKMGAEAAVAAGPVGRAASAETDLVMRAEMLAWSRSRGVFAGIALQGSTLRQDTGENKSLYGRELSNKDILKSNVAPPADAAPLMKALAKY